MYFSPFCHLVPHQGPFPFLLPKTPTLGPEMRRTGAQARCSSDATVQAPAPAPILPRRPPQGQLRAELSFTYPGRCLRRRWQRRRRRQVRRQKAWQTLTAQRSIPPRSKLRPLGFLDPCAHSKSRASRSSQLTVAHAAPPTRAQLRAQSRRGGASGVGEAKKELSAHFRVGGACHPSWCTYSGSPAGWPHHSLLTLRWTTGFRGSDAPNFL